MPWDDAPPAADSLSEAAEGEGREERRWPPRGEDEGPRADPAPTDDLVAEPPAVCDRNVTVRPGRLSVNDPVPALGRTRVLFPRPLSPDIDPEPASAGGGVQEESPLAAGRLWPRPPEAVGSPVAPHPKDGAPDTKQERQDGDEDQGNVEESSQRWFMIRRADGISRERGAIRLRGKGGPG